jgi:hypothetical protein
MSPRSNHSLLYRRFLVFPIIPGNLLLARSKPREPNYIGFLHSKNTVCLREAGTEFIESCRSRRNPSPIYDWNNNNAEHAVKPFAELRQTIGGVTTEKGLRDYLLLLSLCQSCKYVGLDFLDFLRSGEKDLHAFAHSRRRHGPG